MLKALTRAPWILVVTVLLCVTATAWGQETITATWPGEPRYIPDNGTLFAEIFVPRTLEIEDVDVKVNIVHQNMADLNISLTKGLTTVLLVDRECETIGMNVTFDDEAADRIGSVCPPGPFRYRTDGDDLRDFDGGNSYGLWILTVEDKDLREFGALWGYSLTITGTGETNEPTFTFDGVTDAASFASGSVTPGETISIFGAGLGPREPVLAEFNQMGELPTELAGTEVVINGQRAPLFFVSNYQINAQIPWIPPAVLPATIPISVTFQGVASDAVQVTAQENSPGLYSANGTGAGQATVYNGDSTLNGPSNPALRGTSVFAYVNGIGPVSPPIASGQAPPLEPLRLATSEVRVLIGSEQIASQWVGLAPGFVGVFQLNFALPADMKTGIDLPMYVIANGVPSQSGMKVSVQ